MALTGVMTVTDDDLRPVPMTRLQYEVLTAADAFDDERIELLEGMVVQKVPQKPIHSNHVMRIAQHLTLLLAEAFTHRYLVGVGAPVAAGRWSEPEPDVSVLDTDALTDDAHPTTAHLAVEVSRSSLRRDLMVKPRIYARAGIPRYWVVDIAAREAVVHTDPFADGDELASTTAGYKLIRRVPMDTELEVLGLTVRLTDALG